MIDDMIEEVVTAAEPVDPLLMLMEIARASGDISPMLETDVIARIGSNAIRDYTADLASREEWQSVAEKALKSAAMTGKEGSKDYPWPKASNVQYPLLCVAALQFNARTYPAIVKGDEAVSIKVVGNDKGRPQVGPDGQPLMQVGGMQVMMTPQGPAVLTPQGPMALPPGMQPEPVWAKQPGAKTKRAGRVRDYLNTVLFYRMDNWEGETDALIFQLPIVGCGFRKIWYDVLRGKHCAAFVPALKLVVPNDAKSLAEAPRYTEEIDGVFPFEIKRRQRSGVYRDVEIEMGDEEKARCLLEHHCYADLDGDGVDEPYIVTIDKESETVLKIEPNFGPADVQMLDGQVIAIERGAYYVKYEFLPHPEGKFYTLGFGHLLAEYGEVINTIINQMLDANHAAVAGGGFIASGLRLQGQGQSSSLRWRPGEYKAVAAQGAALREGIVERTFPAVSPVMLQLLDMILAAAKDISSVTDVITGDASNNGQVGTTLALIEQSLQMFTAIYKRIYRGLKAEFTMLHDNIGKYGTEETAKDYDNVLDDPEANFAEDFRAQDMDIRPVSDPTSVTKMQKMARASFLMETMEPLAQVGGDPRAALRRVYEAADVEDLDELFPEAKPDPAAEEAKQLQMREMAAKVTKTESEAFKNVAAANAQTESTQLDRDKATFEALKAGYAGQ